MWQHLREIINEASDTEQSSSDNNADDNPNNNMPHLVITIDPPSTYPNAGPPDIFNKEMRDDVPSSAILENQSIIIRTNPSLDDDID